MKEELEEAEELGPGDASSTERVYLQEGEAFLHGDRDV